MGIHKTAMESTGMIFAVLTAIFLPCVVLGDTCLAPEVKSESYTTTEAVSSVDTVFIIQFSLKCKNNLKDINLYADIGGRTLPVAKTGKPDSYQVSFSDEHKSLPKGTYSVKLYDEEGYAALRKMQRSGEGADTVEPLHTLSLSHNGVWKGPFVQSEFVAAMVAILVWYLAYSARSKLQSTN